MNTTQTLCPGPIVEHIDDVFECALGCGRTPLDHELGLSCGWAVSGIEGQMPLLTHTCSGCAPKRHLTVVGRG